MINNCIDQSLWEQSSIRLAEKHIRNKLSLLGLKIQITNNKEQFLNCSNEPEYYHLGDFKVILESSWNGTPIFFENKFRSKKKYMHYNKDINFEIWDDEPKTRKSNLQCIRSDYIAYFWMNTNPPSPPSEIYGGIICDREKLVSHVKENWYVGLEYSKNLLPSRNPNHTTWNCFIPWEIAKECSMESTIRQYLDERK